MSAYDYLLHKFNLIFNPLNYNESIITYCNMSLSISINKNINLENIYSLCNIEDNFTDSINFYRLQIIDNKILDENDKNDKSDNNLIFYFLNKSSQTKIIIKLNKSGIFDISSSNRNKKNIDYKDIVHILYKLFNIIDIDVRLINNLSLNMIQSYSNISINFDKIKNLLKDNKISSHCISINFNKSQNKSQTNSMIYIFQTGILLTSSDYNDMIEMYDYINLLINEYIFIEKYDKIMNINDFLMEVAL